MHTTPSLLLTFEEVGQLVSGSGNPSHTLTNIVNLIQRRFGTDVCSVYLLEPDRITLVLAATIGLRPQSVGRVRSFHGNFGMMVRAYTYIRELGPKGLRAVSDLAVLNANYIAARLKSVLPLAFETPPLHEAVFTDRELEAKNFRVIV